MIRSRPKIAKADDAVRVLVVDDSDVVRRLVVAVIDSDPNLVVVGTAAHGREALDEVAAGPPDVIVLDLEMPTMSGPETFSILQALHPEVAVIVFSNCDLPPAGALAQAVEDSVAEFVRKPAAVADINDALDQMKQTLLPKIRERHKVEQPPVAPAPPRPRLTPTSAQTIEAIVIGASTGGPQALETVFGSLLRALPVPIFVVQHLSAEFTDRLVDRLSRSSAAEVVEARAGEEPRPGMVYLAPGGVHLALLVDGPKVFITHKQSPPVNSCRPAVDVLFESSAAVYGPNQLAIMLTGMGKDGLAGCQTLSACGAPILTQDEPSSVVWGMPGAVVEANLADEILPLREVSTRIERWLVGSRTRVGQR